MKFYTFWARGAAKVESKTRPWTIRVCGGSNESIEEARKQANERARRAAMAIAEGRFGHYEYDTRSFREEIVQKVEDANGLVAIITRNSYGALVLNTSGVMFVDVDLPQETIAAPTLRGLWNALRGKPEASKPDPSEAILSRIEGVTREHTGLGGRVYRTAGGFRLLVTSNTYDPKSDTTTHLLNEFGSDPLYTRMCKAQECFRARLSAKFWRCGVRRPPARMPWDDASQEQQYRQWEEEYHRVANRFATCEFVGTFGSQEVCTNVKPIMETHDRLAIQQGAPLA